MIGTAERAGKHRVLLATSMRWRGEYQQERIDMHERHETERRGPVRSPVRRTTRIGRWLLAGALPLALVLPTASASSQRPTQAQAQGPWRGLDVPRYPRGSDFRIEADDDEYEIYFRSPANVRAVYDFYRAFLQKQGFRVVRSKAKAQGFKADMVRGRGGPDGMIELDVKLKDGLHKVEIEFDE